MKNQIFNRKLIVSVLAVMVLVCVLHGTSHGGGTVGDIVGGIVSVTVGLVDVAVGVAEVAVGVIDLTVSLVTTLTLHTAAVTTAIFSPDGATLISASLDLTIALWDLTTGLLRATLQHLSPVLSLALCPIDACLLASATLDGNLHLWNPDTGQLVRTLTGHTGAILSTAFSLLDHTLLASGSADGTIRLWNAETGTNQRTLTGHTDSVLTVVLLFRWGQPSGARWPAAARTAPFASGTQTPGCCTNAHSHRTYRFGSDRRFQSRRRACWPAEVRTARPVSGIPSPGITRPRLDHESPVLSMAFSPEATACSLPAAADGSVHLWDPLTWEREATLGHESPVRSLSFSPRRQPAGQREPRTARSASGRSRQVPLCCPAYPGQGFQYPENRQETIFLLESGRTESHHVGIAISPGSFSPTTWPQRPVTQAKISRGSTSTENSVDPKGIWSDGTTMWVADDSDEKLVRLRHDVTKARDPGKEFNYPGKQ